MTSHIVTTLPDFEVQPAEGGASGAWLRFPYDRALVRRFRRRFPRARWHGDRWFVPGVRATARVEAWAAVEAAALPRHGDARGRDALAFEPIDSAFVETAPDALIVRTPFAPAVVAALREVPFAAWDPADRVWRVPLRSVDDLRRALPAIEAAVERRREANRRKAAGEPTPPPTPAERQRANARRRRRYPVPVDDLPPPDRPVATTLGIVVFTGTDGEMVEPADAALAFPFVAAGDHVWAVWRPPHWHELRRLRPVERTEAAAWWPPATADIDEAEARLRRVRRTPASGPPTGTMPAAAGTSRRPTR